MDLRTDRFSLKQVFPERAKKYAQKLHRKADEIEYIRKAIPMEATELSVEEGERAAIRLVTTPRLDRDEEILLPDGAILDDFRASPSVFYGHDYSSLPIGKDTWIKPTKRGILAKTQYAQHQFAEDVFQCVKGGFLNSNSVGFIPVERVTSSDKMFDSVVDILEKDYGVPREEAAKARNIYTKWIMLEHSDVGVASNAQSLNLAVSKGELVINSDALKKDLGLVDASPDADVSANVETADAGEIHHKPETTDNYHRIPVSDGHGDHEIRTITVSADEGIKALYCVTCKEIVTYLFDVEKFTMEEARRWVEEHKGKGVFIVDEKPDPYLRAFTDYGGAQMKEAAPAPAPEATPIVPAPDLLALISQINDRLAALESRPVAVAPLAAPAPIAAPAPAHADDIAIEEPTPEEITIDDAPKHAQAERLTLEEIEEAINRAVKGLDIRLIIKDSVDLALDKMRGRVR